MTQRYGAPEGWPRWAQGPTSQQLQDFRDQLAQARDLEIRGPEEGGAWGYELKQGIGYRQEVGNLIWSQWHPSVEARRGGSQLRRDEYERQLADFSAFDQLEEAEARVQRRLVL